MRNDFLLAREKIYPTALYLIHCRERTCDKSSHGQPRISRDRQGGKNAVFTEGARVIFCKVCKVQCRMQNAECRMKNRLGYCVLPEAVTRKGRYDAALTHHALRRGRGNRRGK